MIRLMARQARDVVEIQAESIISGVGWVGLRGTDIDGDQVRDVVEIQVERIM